MTRVVAKRVTADIEGDFVVFLIGMRINKPWKLHKWLPVFMAMPKMIRELEERPESGFLGHVMSLGVIVQYWHPSSILRRMPETLTACTGLRGWTSTSGSAAAAETWVSGTRLTACAPGNTSACTAACRPLA